MTYITNDVGLGGMDSYTMYNGLEDKWQRFLVTNYAFWIHLSGFRKMFVFNSNIKATKNKFFNVRFSWEEWPQIEAEKYAEINIRLNWKLDWKQYGFDIISTSQLDNTYTVFFSKSMELIIYVILIANTHVSLRTKTKRMSFCTKIVKFYLFSLVIK